MVAFPYLAKLISMLKLELPGPNLVEHCYFVFQREGGDSIKYHCEIISSELQSDERERETFGIRSIESHQKRLGGFSEAGVYAMMQLHFIDIDDISGTGV